MAPRNHKKAHINPAELLDEHWPSLSLPIEDWAERSSWVNTTFTMPTLNPYGFCAYVPTVCTVVVYYHLRNLYKLRYETNVPFELMNVPRFVSYEVLSVLHQDHPSFNSSVVARWKHLHEPEEETVMNMGVETGLLHIYACEFCGGDLPVHAGIANMDNMPECRRKRDNALAARWTANAPGELEWFHTQPM